MNQASLTALKRDLSQAGIHYGVLLGMPARTARQLARSMKVRRRETQASRKTTRPFAPKVFEASKRKQEASRSILSKVVNKVKEAFRR